MVERFEITHDNDIGMIHRPHPNGYYVRWSDYEALRAELEQVKRERDEAVARADRQKAAGFCDAFNLTDGEPVKCGWQRRAEAAERLAGARMKAARDLDPSACTNEHGDYLTLEDAVRDILAAFRRDYRTVGYRSDLWTILEECQIVRLSALAEPDGEAEPCQFLPTEDGEFNGNTFGNGDDVPFGWITQRAYDHAYTTSDPVQVTILRTESGPGLMPRVPLYTTPPDASAIREALEPFAEVAGKWVDDEGWTELASQNDRICDWFGPSDFRAAIRALAGAKP